MVEFEGGVQDEEEYKTRPENGSRSESCVISWPLGPPPTVRMVRSLRVRVSDGRGIEDGLRKKMEWKAQGDAERGWITRDVVLPAVSIADEEVEFMVLRLQGRYDPSPFSIVPLPVPPCGRYPGIEPYVRS